jgi:ribosomal protein S18 acetylase RimI-like enzyme
MSDRLAVAGSWPGKLVMASGWSRAEARPWNDSTTGAQLRLVRGSSGFLSICAERLVDETAGPVHSPALFPSMAAAYRRAGFAEIASLTVMEHHLDAGTSSDLPPEADPSWDDVVRIDNLSFEPFWRLGRHGLEEASAATRRSTVITARTEGSVTGFAIVGAEHGVSYLQRLAVEPEARGQGTGRLLVEQAKTWARRRRARVMMLNVKAEAAAARALYLSAGFSDTGSTLLLMRWDEPRAY